MSKGFTPLDNGWIQTEAKHIKTRAALVTYLVLRSHRRNDPVYAQCNPSRETLHKETGLSYSHLSKALAVLRDLGLVEVVQPRWGNTGKFKRNEYKVYDWTGTV